MTMLAKPVRLSGGRYALCAVEEATHITLEIPGPTGRLTLPVILKGARACTGCWTWNGSTAAPTLRPSVLTQGHDYRCHSWISDGVVQYLQDCSHYLQGQMAPLKPVEDVSCDA